MLWKLTRSTLQRAIARNPQFVRSTVRQKEDRNMMNSYEEPKLYVRQASTVDGLLHRIVNWFMAEEYRLVGFWMLPFLPGEGVLIWGSFCWQNTLHDGQPFNDSIQAIIWASILGFFWILLALIWIWEKEESNSKKKDQRAMKFEILEREALGHA